MRSGSRDGGSTAIGTAEMGCSAGTEQHKDQGSQILHHDAQWKWDARTRRPSLGIDAQKWFRHVLLHSEEDGDEGGRCAEGTQDGQSNRKETLTRLFFCIIRAP